LPKKFFLQNEPDTVKFLRQVLLFNQSDDKLEENATLERCYKRGWLQAEESAEGKTVYVFPTRIHQRYNIFICL
jgi:hypothetical protein